MDQDKNRRATFASTVYQTALARGVLFIRCKVYESRRSDHCSADVDVLHLAKILAIGGETDAKWQDGFLLHYNYKTWFGRDSGIVQGADVSSRLVTPKSVVEDVAAVISHWRALEFSNWVGAENAFAAVVSIVRNDSPQAVSLGEIGATHPTVLPYLTQSLGYLYASREKHLADLRSRFKEAWSSNAPFDAFVRSYGNAVAKAEKEVRITCFGRQ